MNKIIRKLKRSNKPIRYIYYILNIAYIISLSFFIKSLISLKGIETILRIIIIIFFILYIIYYSFGNLLNLLRKKYKVVIITSFITLIFIVIFSFASYYINVIYSNLNNMTDSNEVTYTSYLITLIDKEFSEDSTIGIISRDIEEDDYDLGRELINDNKLNNELIDYSDYYVMLNSLYNGEVDSIIVPGNYITLFQNEDEYMNIANETKIIYKYVSKRTNEDMLLKSTKDFSEPLTFLLLGVDSDSDGLDEATSFNGDTLMIVSFNPKTLKTTMLSIPRDTFVPIACRNNQYAKINSSAAYGTSCVVNTISNLIDVDIDYYIKINFKGVVELVDALGGIEVDVEKPYFNSYNGVNYGGKVCEQNSNRQYGSSLVCMDTGLQTLDGEQALAYARNRHLYIGSDLDRIRHQQQVVEAIANKALQSSVSDLEKILNAISNNIATNMNTNTILSGYQVAKKMVGNLITGKSALSIEKAYLETYSLGVYIPAQGRNTSAQGYYLDSLEEIKQALKVTLGKESEAAIKTFSYSANEVYETTSPGKGKRSEQSSLLLPSFIGKTLTEAEDFCNKNNIKLNVRYVDSDSEYYNSNINVGLIGNQSVHSEVLLSSVTELTVYIVNSSNTTTKEPIEEKTNTKENNTTNNTTEEEITEEIEDITNIMNIDGEIN